MVACACRVWKQEKEEKLLKYFVIIFLLYISFNLFFVELSLRSINICIYMCFLCFFFSLIHSSMAIKVFHTRLKRNMRTHWWGWVAMRAATRPAFSKYPNRKWKHFQVICNPQQNLQLWADLSIMKMKTELAQLETSSSYDWIARKREK